MDAISTNDDRSGASLRGVDDALLLVESLIHGLIASGAMTVMEAVDVVDIAVDVKVQLLREGGVSLEDEAVLLTPLRSITESLRHDLNRK